MQMVMSATLKTGQKRKFRKSTTFPSQNRSKKFANRPPHNNPRVIFCHRLFREIFPKRNSRTAIIMPLTTIIEIVGGKNKPKMIPLFSR